MTSPAKQLLKDGAKYALHVVGDWYEVDSYSDGMCGWVAVENVKTTEYTSFHWNVFSDSCSSQDAARDAARQELAGEDA